MDIVVTEAMTLMIRGNVVESGTVVLDNSSAFKNYLHKHGMDEGLAKHKLRLRDVNRIVPHVSRSAS
jgi:hypothetical protein